MHLHPHAWTLAFQIVNFLVLAWLLKRLLFAPAMRVMTRRREEAARVLGDAERARTEAQAALSQVDAARAGMEKVVAERLREREEKAEQDRTALLDGARHEAEAFAATTRQRLEEERVAVATELEERAAELAVRLASALLADARPDGLAGAFLERAARHIAALPADERAALREQLGADGAVRVTTAPPLAEGEQPGCRARIQAALGAPVRVEFADDPALVGGVEVAFPKTVLRVHWRDALARAQRELVEHARAA